MEWYWLLIILVGGAIALMLTGLPVAFAFLLLNMVCVLIFWGGSNGLNQFILSISHAAGNADLVAVVMFVLMGEVMFYSGIAPSMMDALDKWIGRMPGRLGLLAVASGTVLSSLTGTSMASVAVLGGTLVPETEKRGYKKPMSLGPILGSGGLAIMIPPSGLAVLLGAIGRLSIGQILMAIIIPGLLMALSYCLYIIVRCLLQPDIAPAYSIEHVSFSEKIIVTVKYILPLALIIFLVIGVIFLGIATPSEAASSGALGTFILAIAHRKLTRKTFIEAMGGTIRVAIMLLMIIIAVEAFNQILAYTGATSGMVEFVLSLDVSPLWVIVFIQLMLLVLGTFMEVVSIMMITVPIFVPVVTAIGFNPVWFAIIFLLNMEIATTSPPFGLNLFVMKGVAPEDTTMGDIYKAALPFIGCDILILIIIIIFPGIALWLPRMMG